MSPDAWQELAGGRSNRVFRSGATVLKIYDSKRRNPLFANDPRREQAALQTLQATGLAPQVLGSGQTLGYDWLLYTHIEGTGWTAGPAKVAALLSQVHAQTPPADIPRGANGSTDISNQVTDILRECPDAQSLQALRPKKQVDPTRTLALLHGDPVPGNIVVSDNRLCLIDWQCPVCGDPAEDLAIFLSPAMQFLYRGAPLTQAEEDEFLAAYPNAAAKARLQALLPWYHWRMAAYCLWRTQFGDDADRQALELELKKLASLSA